MIDSKDLYIYQVVIPLTDTTSTSSDSNPPPFGTAIISYEIRRYRDIRNLKEDFTYQIFCTQRIVIPNATPYTPGANSDNTTSFDNYPAIVSNTIQVKKIPSDATQWLVDYTPRTINASVSQSSSQGGQSSSSTTMQQSSGSTLSQSNTYGASANVGFWGGDPTGGISVSASHESGRSTNHENTTGTEKNVSSVTSTGDNYSVKDWASYAFTDEANSTINWVWGQEYPWNVLQYRNSPTKGGSITLPTFVQDLLLDTDNGKILLPPSMLSQFGIDFSMKAAWLVSLDANPSSTKVKLEHKLDYYTASHQLSGSTVIGDINKTANSKFTSDNIDLCLYGLDPITEAGVTSSAIVGFLPAKYLVQPKPYSGSKNSAKNFSILAINNNLSIKDTTDYSNCGSGDKGAGFSAADTALQATFTENCQSLTFQVGFKIIDTTSNYYLYFKHWILDSEEVLMTITVNGDTSNPFIKLINAQEAEGGENNVLEIALRHLNFGSIDYHDHLQLGINTIDVNLVPSNSKNITAAGYQLRALSVEAK